MEMETMGAMPDFDSWEEFPEDDEDLDLDLEAQLAAIEAQRWEPKPYKLKVTKKRIAVVDTETDPFEHGFIVRPFTLGFYDGKTYVDFWGDDCVDQFFSYLATLEDDFIIYAHNGGKFDFHFFTQYFDPDQSPLIMGGRFVKLFMQGQEFRDSFAIIPQGLASYQKDVIDYANFVRSKRERHKAAILKYQKADCVYLFDLIEGFHDLFGDRLTVASAALPMLNSYTGFERFSSEKVDERFRNYYFGGRNQCFETGILPGAWKVYDRNSMYPAVMRDELHPVSNEFQLQSAIDENTDFACIEAYNENCLPMRREDGGLDFTVKEGTFHATIHEILAGIDTGTLKIKAVKHAWAFTKKVSFAEFVNRFYELRLLAKADHDKIRDILYKLILNSAYGKFALNPRKFRQWTFTIDSFPDPLISPDNPDGWSMHSQSGSLFIWSRPAPRRNGFYNVATAASITGAARANLHRNLMLSKRPIYCDTDSIICEDFSGDLDESRLGGWKLEATGDMAAIGGKKLYAVFNNNETVKRAAKGVGISPAEIIRVCQGETIRYDNPAPTFKFDGTVEFISRNVRKTGTI